MRSLQLFTKEKPFEFSNEGGAAQVVGYIPYYSGKPGDGTEYTVNDRLKMRFNQGSFANALASGQPIMAFFNHDSSTVFARTDLGTLSFADFPSFLRYTITLDLTDSDAAKVYSKISKGLVQGTSFGGYITAEDWFSEDQYDVNVVTEFALNEVSPCPQPAFTGSKAIIRSNDQKDMEESWNKWQHDLRIKRYEEIKASLTK